MADLRKYLDNLRRVATKSLTQVREFLTKERHLKMPYLELYLRLPLLTVRTSLWSEQLNRYVYEYIGVDIKLWKWDWRFRLYEPGEKRNLIK